MRKVIYLIAIMVAFSAAQNHDEKQAGHKDNHSDDSHMKAEGHGHGSKKTQERDIELSVEKSNLLAGVIDNYILLKNALVDDDSKSAASSAEIMIKSYNDINTAKLTDSQKKEYKEITENSLENLEHIVKSPIDHQREHFEAVSDDLRDLITLIGTDKHLYVDFCPMVNKGEGAIWISETEGIKNPYLGSKNKCGKVQKEIN